MSRTRRLLLLSLLLLTGCRGGPVAQESDRMLLEIARHPFDPAPAAEGKPRTDESAPPKPSSTTGNNVPSSADASEPEADVRTVAMMQADRPPGMLPEYKLTIPSGLPGSETPLLKRLDKMTKEERSRYIKELYPALEPLPEPSTPQPGPDGVPYTLADLQKLAVENNHALRQAVYDVKSAEGNLYQATLYQNPRIAYSGQPTNNNSNAGAQGFYIGQPFRMWGKMKMGIAIAQKDLDNAHLALRRARYDLSTNVRNAYFALLVAKETMRVTRALALFTDEIYRLYTGYLESNIMALYEPAPLRAQASAARLAYRQAITNYNYAWTGLVATLGIDQLPLTEVSGRVDRLIPYYDYDQVRAYVLTHHTDVLTARNAVKRAQYNLKLAQITPYPDVEVQGSMWKESTIVPYTIFYAAQVSFPIPIWDQNRGNIMAAQAAMLRAIEETRRVENALTATLSANYNNYRNNLYALEYYRRWILPDQVRYYRGIFERRQADLNASPADLVTAQQGFAGSVTNYLSILGSLWTSVVSVADLMQTPDLFQAATPRSLPELPDLQQLPNWLCPSPRPSSAAAVAVPNAAVPGLPARPSAGEPVLPAPRPTEEAPSLPPPDKQQPPQRKAAEPPPELLEPPPEIPKRKIEQG